MNVSVPMKVIDKPVRGTKGILHKPQDSDNSIFGVGTGNIDLVCGKCSTILYKNASMNSIPDMVFVCPICNSYNERVDSMTEYKECPGECPWCNTCEACGAPKEHYNPDCDECCNCLNDEGV